MCTAANLVEFNFVLFAEKIRVDSSRYTKSSMFEARLSWNHSPFWEQISGYVSHLCAKITTVQRSCLIS